MNISKKLTAAVTGAVLVASLGLGTMASAADTSTTTPSAATVEARCDREPQVTARYDKVHAAMAKRLANLQARHDKAVANGHTKLANRLQRVIDRLTKADQRITVRYDKYEAWVAANCNG